MKIAIIGGAGFVGSHLVGAFVNAGHDVFVVDSLAHGAREAVDRRARFYHLDVRDGKLQAILQTERPDIVSYHVVQRERTLPWQGLLIDADVHIRGLLNVLDACVQAQVAKLIFASSGNSLYRRSALHEACDLVPVSEEMEVCPLHPQDISTVAGEWYVRYYTRQYGLPHLILRYADIYGEVDPARAWHPLTSFVAHLLQQQRPAIRGTDRDVRDHIFIDDVISANFCALERGRNETLHISSGQGYTLREFYHVATRLLRSEITPAYISASQAEPGGVILDNRRARQVLRWQPEVDLIGGVSMAVERLGGLCSEVHTGPIAVEALEEESVQAREEREGTTSTRSAVLV